MPAFLVVGLSSGIAKAGVKKGKFSAAARAFAEERKERIKNEIRRIGETAEIFEIQEHASRARIIQVGIDSEKPKVGWKLSTRLIDRALPPK